MIFKLPHLFCLFITLILVAGCASSPESRIEKNPQIFDKFSEEEQAKIRNGEVELGFTEQMVYLAIGAPDRKKTRITEEETTESWIYQGYRRSHSFYRSRYQYYPGWYYCRSHHHFVRYRPWLYSPFYDTDRYESYPRKIVRFQDGKVVSIESERK